MTYHIQNYKQCAFYNCIQHTMQISCMALIFLLGCTQNTKEIHPNSLSSDTYFSPITSEDNRVMESKYNQYILLMSVGERSDFLQLASDTERDLFIQVRGLDLQKYLHDSLHKEMPSVKVSELLGSPRIQESILLPHKHENRWTYTFFNGYTNIQYVVILEDNKVTRWEVSEE